MPLSRGLYSCLRHEKAPVGSFRSKSNTVFKVSIKRNMFSNFLQNKIKASLCMYALVSTMAIPSMAASFEVQPLPNEVKSRIIEKFR